MALVAAAAARLPATSQREPLCRGPRARGVCAKPCLPRSTGPSAVEPGGPVEPDVLNRRRAVVYFEAAPRGAFEDRESARVSLDQRNETFVPHVLAITAGTTVDFPNHDRTYHNVFSLSKAKRFDLGRYAAGTSKSVRFDRPGIVRVFCDIHSHMNAFILVFGHRFFAVTDDEGRYEIDGVPPGTYTLSAWFEGAVREQRALARDRRHARDRARLHGAMTLLSSLTNRIFLASALLAIVAIGLAMYLVSARVTREAEAELERGLMQSGALVEEHRRALSHDFLLLARLVADLPKFKAAVETQDAPTVRPIAEDYRRQLDADLLLVTDRRGALLFGDYDARSARRSCRRSPRRCKGREAAAFWPHPHGILEVVTVPIAVGREVPEVLGTLSAGFLLDDRRAEQFKRATASEIAFAAGRAHPGRDAAGARTRARSRGMRRRRASRGCCSATRSS